MGYLLRCAARNGISIHRLLELAGISDVRMIWAADTPRLALTLGVPVSVLWPMFIQQGQFQDDVAHRVGGHMFARVGTLRPSHPQICVTCIHHSGYCRAIWDCGVYTVCHIHRTALTDRCGSCGAAIRRYRPAVDVCGCGAYFRAGSASTHDRNDAALQIAAMVAERFGEPVDAGDLANEALPWRASLSVDGLCTLVRAFGVCVGAHQRVVSASLLRQRCEFWRAVCARAGARFQQYSNVTERESLAPFIWEAALDRMIWTPVASADHQVASLLMQQIYGRHLGEGGRSKSKMLSQMKLFDGADYG